MANLNVLAFLFIWLEIPQTPDKGQGISWQGKVNLSRFFQNFMGLKRHWIY